MPTFADSLCALFPARGFSAAEEFDTRTAASATHRAFFAPGTDIRFTDKVEMADSRTFEVVGEPRVWEHPKTLRPIYVDVDLKSYTDDEEESSGSP